jgi:parallel beta-helix repeat protein
VLDSRRLRGILYLGFSIALLSLSISAQDQSGATDPLAGEGDMSFLVPSASALPGEAEANTVGPVPGAGVDYTSIQEAIDGSKPGDVIYVQSGNYSENVEVNKTAIVLKGVDTGGGKPVVAGDGVGSTITLSADGCTLDGFVVMNSGNPHAGIDVRSNGNTIMSNIVRGNRGYGMSISNSSENAIERNTVSNNGFDGIFLVGSRRNDIFGNTVNSNKMNGIWLVDSDENTIASNAIVNNGLYGALLERSNRNVITENTILHNLKGGICLVDSTGNIITRNNYDDISLVNSEGNTIEDNNQVERYGHYASDPSGEENKEYEELPEDSLFIVQLTASVSEVERGDTITFTIRLLNPVVPMLTAGDLTVTDIVVKSVFNREVELSSVSPSPDPDGLWRFDEIGLGESETITLVVKVPRKNFEYQSASGVNGVGFINVEDAFKPSFDSYVLRSEVFVTFNITGYNDTWAGSAYDFEDVSVLGTGTELRSREHGSGRYESDETVSVLTENRSISMDKEVFASYEPVTLGLYRNRTVTYSSRWTEEAQAKNRVTGTSMRESYRYATSIDRESQVLLDKNESTMEVDSKFDGTGHFSLFKTRGPETSVKSPDFEFLEDYTGSFRVYEKLDLYGSSVTSEKSASGEGLVSTDKRIGDGQRSHESGSGTYESEEVIATSTSYIAKDLALVSGPTSTELFGDLFVNSSMRWNEGIWSKVENRSLISENYASLDRLDKVTVARGLNTMETEASFSGRAGYRTILAGQADFDDEYEGDYSLERKVLFRGVPKYDLPHLNVMKVERIVSIPSKNEVFANYMITVENDGNQDLSPVYVKDLFPPGAEYVNSSMRPALGSASATWTLTHLDSGERYEIDLWLNVTGCCGEMVVNRVEATGLYDDQSVSASNSSSSEIGWLSCCEPETSVALTKTAYVSPKNPNKIWYLVEVQNKGDSTKVVKITDTLPKGMKLLEASPDFAYYESDQVSWNLIDLWPKETGIIIYEVEVFWSGSFENGVSVSVESVDGGVEASTGTTSVITVAEFAGELARPGWTTPDWDLEYAGRAEGSV